MRIFHYKHKNDAPHKSIVAIMEELETELGFKLQIDDINDPNKVHGYVNTFVTDDGVGHVAVHLYERKDVRRIARMPDAAVAHRRIYRVHSMGDQEVHDRVMKSLGKRGYKHHTEVE